MIKNLRFRNGFKGHYDIETCLIYGNSHLNIPKGSYEWPIQEMMNYDKQFGTRFSFYSNSQFTDDDLRTINRNHPATSRALNNYFFSNLLQRTYSDFVGVQCIDNAAMLQVRCSYIFIIRHIPTYCLFSVHQHVYF